MIQYNMIVNKNKYRFKVNFSNEIKNKIQKIYYLNRNNTQALSAWNDYLENI